MQCWVMFSGSMCLASACMCFITLLLSDCLCMATKWESLLAFSIRQHACMVTACLIKMPVQTVRTCALASSWEGPVRNLCALSRHFPLPCTWSDSCVGVIQSSCRVLPNLIPYHAVGHLCGVTLWHQFYLVAIWPCAGRH